MRDQPTDPMNDEYDGPATVVLGESSVTVEVRLRGHFEPIDGRFHWYGRIAADPGLDSHAAGGRIRLRTPLGEAEGRLSDPDPWGRLRVTGAGRPPF